MLSTSSDAVVKALSAPDLTAGGAEPQEEEEKHAGPAGGVQPGLPQDAGRGIQGPEPLMGVKRLDKLEQGHLLPGSTAVSPP